MAEPTLRRPRRIFERSWPWLIIAIVLAAGLGAASFLGIRQLQKRVPASGASTFRLLSALGAVTVLLILLTFFYQVRKRLMQENLGGTMMMWLKGHVYLGLLALAAAIAHATIFPLTSNISSGKITGAILVLLVVSGALWRTVYARTPRAVAENVGNLAIKDTVESVATLRIELVKLQVGKTKLFQDAVNDLVSHRRKIRELQKDLTGLNVAERVVWEQARALVDRIHELEKKEHKQKRYSRFMQGWKAIHLPLAALLLGSIGYHLYDVFNADRFFSAAPQKQFASASDCARCHSQIVNEWRLSMHRDAGTSTTTVSQSPFTLSKFPGFGKICVNCHMPIGVKFSQKATFPLAQGAGADPGPNAELGVASEGVTCVVCHTLPHPPDEMSGASDKLPVGTRSATSFGTLFGPPLDGQIPTSTHEVATGFMTSTVTASKVCATCHDVKADINGNGLVNPALGAPATGTATAGDAPPLDSNGNGVLDENELDIVDGKLQDLVLQTTFDEWEDYIFAHDGKGASCVDCHMPAATPASLVDHQPAALKEAKRPRQTHVFVAVDYDLNDAYYRQKSMPKDAMQKALEERERFIQTSAQVTVAQQPPDAAGHVVANVQVKGLEGHSFPTGFAFARQFWLQVSAQTASGKQVCLTPAPNGVASPCSSGVISSPTEELKTCENAAPGIVRAAEPFGNDKELKVKVAFSRPVEDCDPWLTNFQKILSDGDPDHDGTFTEVAHQSLLGDIVKLRIRVADDQVMKPIPSGGTSSFDYIFDASAAGGEPVQVKAILRLRHLPPYFIEALAPFAPIKDLTPAKLLKNMTVVDVASNLPMNSVRTTPDPASFSNASLAKRVQAAKLKSAQRNSGGPRGPFGYPMLLGAGILLPAAMLRLSRRL